MSTVTSVTSHFSTANEGFSTTTSGPITAGATTVPLTATTGMTNGTIFVGIIEPSGTKEQVFTGTVNTGSSSITGVVWTKGTNVDHAAGVTIVDYVTGTDHNMMTKGILVQHNQDGTHSSITATTATIASGLTVTAGTVSLPTASTSTRALANPVSFRAYLNTGTFAVAGPGWATVPFDTTTWNTGSGFNTTTHRFTAPYNGIYHFDSSIEVSTGWADIILSIWKNGTEYSRGTRYRSSGGTVATNFAPPTSLFVGGAVQMVATDYIEFKAYADDGDSNNGGTIWCWASGFMVSAT